MGSTSNAPPLAFAAAMLAGGMYLATMNHPCGHAAGILEVTGFHDSLPPSTESCLVFAGIERPSPERWISSFNALFTMLFQVQSRYLETWQAAQSYHFELEVAEYLGVQRAQYITSGDAALVVALQAIGVGPKDEVVIPTYAPIRTFSSVSVNGAIPIMANIDNLLGLDPQSLARAITPRTKAVIAVHPCNITGLQAVARSRNILLVEDITFVFGSKVHGKFAGTFGAMGFAAIDESGFLSSGGQGGLVWADDAEFIDNMGFAIENGYAAWGGMRNLPSYKRSFGTSGQKPAASSAPFAGHCFRAPSEWHAAYARSELQFNPKKVARILRLKQRFREHFGHGDFIAWGEDQHGVASASLKILFPEEHAHLRDPALHALEDQLRKKDDTKKTARAEAMYRNEAWHMSYLPNVTSLVEKASFHSSGFPWTSEADKAPLNREDYRASEAILGRVINHPLSWHYPESMMTELAGSVASTFSTVGTPR
mmetsp:Transcript_126609/g.358083  ORF Transcript_126609/g.358083 Transcript_126609/m.358083 type:complete len:483 (+) Transcript_126609:63-1511(+)